MKSGDDLPLAIHDLYEIFEWRNAVAILSTVHSEDFEQVLGVLSRFRLRHSDVAQGGGNKSPVSRFIDGELYKLGWKE